VIGRYLGEDPNSKEHFSTIRTWLNACLGHSKCSQTLSGSTRFDARNVPLPTRCIEITEEGLRLRMTRGGMGAYVTLSHRWDDETESSSTTAENYEARISQISYETLPKIFCDAIDIAKRLGIRYVWIDSICIIQKDQRDWEVEAVHMAEYYQQSLFTIAVTGAAQGGRIKGCLSPRKSDSISYLVRLPYRNIHGQQRGYFYVHKRETLPDEQYRSLVHESSLMRRGWVFQEWVLSRRIIHLTQDQLFFECATGIAMNECQEILTLNIGFNRSERNLALKTLLHSDTPFIGDLWCSIIETYSRLDLTKPESDRILAIAGIAKEYRETLILKTDEHHNLISRHLPEYTSGLWLRDIHHGLLWEQVDDSHGILCNCGTPTWSWASLLAPVKWSSRTPRTRNECVIISLVSSDGTHHPVEEAETDSLETADHSTGILQIIHSPNIVTDQFDVTNTFTRLHVRGRLMLLLIKNHVKEDEETLSQIAKMTGHEPDFGRDCWRAICDPETPMILSGWGSFEQPGICRQLSEYEEVMAYALLVSTRAVSEGIRFGYLSWHHDVLNVLFLNLRWGSDCQYQRVGVGRIFDKDLARKFMEAEEEDIYLV